MDRRGPLNRQMISISIMLATIMQTLDTTIANVALPHMQGSLSASQDQIAWVLTSYIVAAAIATPLTGWLCARFGQKEVFLVSVAGFTVASVLCGISDSLVTMVLARLLQGVFGASLVPLSQAVLLEINPREKQGSAMAVWGMGVMVGPILGPTLGGWLTDSYNWRWVFFINVPVGLMAFYGIWRFIDRLPGKKGNGFDWYGFTSLSLAIGALQMLLDRGEQNDWFGSIETWIELTLMTLGFGCFVIHSWYTDPDKAFLDLRLLKNRNYISGLFFIFIVGLVLFAVRAITPTLLQNLLGYPALMAGWVTAPTGLGTMFAMLVVGRLVGRVELRLLLAIGFSLTVFSLWQMSGYNLDIEPSDIVWPGVIQGVGIGLVFVPLSAATFATLDSGMRAQGTALYSLVRNIGSSIGISIVQTLLVRNTQVAHSSLAEHISRTNPALQSPSLIEQLHLHTQAGFMQLNQIVTRQAAMIAYVDDFWLMMVLTLMAMPLLVLMKQPTHPPSKTESAEAMVMD